MPWRETSVMEERLRYVARLLEGEGMSDVCREFGISRKTGYKIFNRYKDDGLEALTDRSRRPVRYANQLPCRFAFNRVLPQFVWCRGSIRAFSSSGPALPYIARLRVLSRLI
ncbi:Helix-turn-helix domain family protein (plasmid) [Rhizobium leguminosarum]|uniref:Helix-turn-helix domain family protein n=1 Tax=Rhizobium leguminosarum TaxID=384 RepID=A0A2Z4YQN8_RHILE|nr:Helix-turn-helix domain family protein [Rhizobium leguminosarum]